MPKPCAEFRNEPQSVTMQRNLRHIWGGQDALSSPIQHFFWGGGGRVPRGIYATVRGGMFNYTPSR